MHVATSASKACNCLSNGLPRRIASR
jgi:hypothetical protein